MNENDNLFEMSLKLFSIVVLIEISLFNYRIENIQQHIMDDVVKVLIKNLPKNKNKFNTKPNGFLSLSDYWLKDLKLQQIIKNKK